MKKIYFTLTFIACSFGIFAQEAANKKVQAGLVAGFGLNFQKMGTKLMDSNGPGTDLTIGANLNFSINENIAFTTGIEFDFETIKYKTSESNVYYRYEDNTILEKEIADSKSNVQLYELSTRKQKPVYLSIPTMMLFRTNYIGYYRYFGKFGLRNSILLKNTINDEGFNFNPDVIVGGERTSASNENMTAASEMVFFKSAVGLAGGAEWNFTGSTCLIAELGYYYGFTPLHYNKKNNDDTFLYSSGYNNGQGNDQYFSIKSTQSQLMLKVSILF